MLEDGEETVTKHQHATDSPVIISPCTDKDKDSQNLLKVLQL